MLTINHVSKHNGLSKYQIATFSRAGINLITTDSKEEIKMHLDLMGVKIGHCTASYSRLFGTIWGMKCFDLVQN